MKGKQAWLSVQVVVSVGLLTLLLRQFDWAAFLAIAGRMSAGFYLGSLLAVAFGQLLYAYRWQVILGTMNIHLPYRSVLRQYLIGLFFSNLMPTTIGGDAARVYYLGRRKGYVQIGASVFMDRCLGFLSLTVLGTCLAWVIGSRAPVFVLNRDLLTALCGVFLAIYLASRFIPVDRLRLRFPGRPSLFRWTEHAAHFLAQIRGVASHPLAIGVAFAVVFTHVSLLAIIYQRYLMLNQASPSLLAIATVVVSVAIFTNIPISINGVGLREQLHYLMFAGLGVSKEVAVGISVLIFSHFLLLSVTGYVVWLHGRTKI